MDGWIIDLDAGCPGRAPGKRSLFDGNRKLCPGDFSEVIGRTQVPLCARCISRQRTLACSDRFEGHVHTCGHDKHVLAGDKCTSLLPKLSLVDTVTGVQMEHKARMWTTIAPALKHCSCAKSCAGGSMQCRGSTCLGSICDPCVCLLH